jgi:hypothetical protein
MKIRWKWRASARLQPDKRCAHRARSFLHAADQPNAFLSPTTGAVMTLADRVLLIHAKPRQ